MGFTKRHGGTAPSADGLNVSIFGTIAEDYRRAKDAVNYMASATRRDVSAASNPADQPETNHGEAFDRMSRSGAYVDGVDGTTIGALAYKLLHPCLTLKAGFNTELFRRRLAYHSDMH